MGSNIVCERCGYLRDGIGNEMYEKCKSCGFQDCPLCGESLNEGGFCLKCLGHMTDESYHSVGMCSICDRMMIEKMRKWDYCYEI